MEPRVRAHVFICILSLLLKRTLEINYLKSKSVLEKLEAVDKSKFVKFKVTHSDKEDRYTVVPRITDFSQEQREIFKSIGLKNPESLENYTW